MVKRKVVVYDLETLQNCFTYTDIDVDTNEVTQFVIHESRNDFKAFIEYLGTLTGMIGYNSVSFDYPIIHWMYTNSYELSALSGNEVAKRIYTKVQEIISTPEDKKFTVRIPHWKEMVPQLDLFLMMHLDNKAKLTSLKSLEFWMNFAKVQDMPIDHRSEVTAEQIPMILDYNKTDVEATLAFYKTCSDHIELRKAIQRDYGIRCINMNNGKIGEQIILKLYCEATGKDPKEVRKLRTERSIIHLNECIPSYAKFETKEFQYIHEFFKKTSITKTKDAFSEDIIHNRMLITYGCGGVHGQSRTGIYTSDKDWIIKSHDVASLYPNLAIVGKFYPEHLGPEFSDIYEKGIVEVRMKEKAKGKLGNKSIIDGFKEAANIPYGKSNEKNSFLFDSLYTLKTTTAGMLALSMLTEMITLAIPECEHIMLNTDGGEVKIPRDKSDLYLKVCKDWEAITGLTLEYAEYDKIVLRDINSYIAVYTNGKVKHKGDLEVEKNCWKDTSFKIVQIALSDYFVKGIPIETTIYNHKNIYDFCGRAKFKNDSFGQTHTLTTDDSGNPIELIEKQQKTTRYYISTKGSTFVKVFPAKNKSNFINKGFLVTIFNNYVEKEDYGINYNFYILEAKKLVETIENKQLLLL